MARAQCLARFGMGSLAWAVLLAAAAVHCSTTEELEIGADGSRAAAAAPGRALPELPADAKFILYDVGFGERFNFRKSVFRRVMGTVDVLSKHADNQPKLLKLKAVPHLLRAAAVARWAPARQSGGQETCA